jgi:hypothetical protein
MIRHFLKLALALAFLAVPAYGQQISTVTSPTGGSGPSFQSAAASGASTSFTIPSSTEWIVISMSGVSGSGTGIVGIVLGDAGGPETSGYVGTSSVLLAASNTSAAISSSFQILNMGSTGSLHGSATLALVSASTNTWGLNGGFARSDAVEAAAVSGAKPLSASITTIAVTLSSGTFDAGTVSILYQ